MSAASIFTALFVFPAPAGVILINSILTFLLECFPRTCGGDPINIMQAATGAKFSPHLRG